MNGETLRRAEEAVRLMECQTMTDAFEGIDLGLVRRWRRAASPEERERIHVQVLMLKELRLTLLAFVRDAAEEEAREKAENGFFTGFFKKITNRNKEQR